MKGTEDPLEARNLDQEVCDAPKCPRLHAHYTDAINESECLLATYLEAGGKSFELAS